MTIIPRSIPHNGAQMPHLYVEFDVFPFADPAVIWLNKRVLHGFGVDTGDESAILSWKNRILFDFGVSTRGPSDPDSIFHVSKRTMHSDRYGAAYGSRHGGSGRAGTVGTLNGKGIGRTPLCDPHADFYHSHGCMWLEEAIREAAFAELAWFEFPFGANPPVAIIDAGAHFHWPDGTPGPRRAVLVRAAAMRLAHLERSIFFGSAGTETSDQFLDARRVKEVASALPDLPDTPGLPDAMPRTAMAVLDRIVENIGRQIGYGRAARLAHGDYASSNLTLAGQLLDFGSFRAVRDWRSAHCVRGIAPFGQEHNNLIASLPAIHRAVARRASGEPALALRDIVQTLVTASARGFETEIRAVVAPFLVIDPKLAEDLAGHLLDEYGEQQRSEVSYLSRKAMDDGAWIHAGLIRDADTPGNPSRRGRTMRAAIQDALSRSPAARPEIGMAFHQLCHWTKPRRDAERERFQADVDAALAKAEDRVTLANFVGRKITDVLTSARRRLASGGGRLVFAHRLASTFCVEASRDLRTGEFGLRIEGVPAGDRTLVNGVAWSSASAGMERVVGTLFDDAFTKTFDDGDGLQAALLRLAAECGEVRMRGLFAHGEISALGDNV